MCSGLLLCQLMGPRGHRQKPSPSLTVASGSSPGKTEKGGAPEGGGALPEAHVAGKEARTNVLPRRRPRGEKNPKFECPKCIYPFCWGVKAKILPEKEGEKKRKGERQAIIIMPDSEAGPLSPGVSGFPQSPAWELSQTIIASSWLCDLEQVVCLSESQFLHLLNRGHSSYLPIIGRSTFCS